MITFSQKIKEISDYCNHHQKFSYHRHLNDEKIKECEKRSKFFAIIDYMYPECKDEGCPLSDYCTVLKRNSDTIKEEVKKVTNKDNNIIHELKACSLWLKEHGRNTNTSIVEVCDRAAEYIKELESEGKTKDALIKALESEGKTKDAMISALESKMNEGEINMYETTPYCPEEELPFEDKVKAHTKRTDQAMSAAHALLTIHNICKENRHTGCEHCVLANEDGCCSIMGKFPLEWKFEIKVW